jgi:hypothetical protein
MVMMIAPGKKKVATAAARSASEAPQATAA